MKLSKNKTCRGCVYYRQYAVGQTGYCHKVGEKHGTVHIVAHNHPKCSNYKKKSGDFQ